MISVGSYRVVVLAIVLVLATSSVPFGAEVPLSFIGTYRGESRACLGSTIVLRKENITWDECKSKNVPYTVVEADEEHVFLGLHSSDCPLSFIRLEGSKLDDANAVHGELRVSGYEALAATYGLDCRYFRVDPALGEDHTERFLHSKSATERKEALHKINLQGDQEHPERDKYNEIGLKDPSPDVREIAAYFLRGEPEHFVPILINMMADDPDGKVRASAGYSLSSFYTDNGSDGDDYIKPLEDNLEKLLSGLKHAETLRSVVDILGNRYAGVSIGPCLMSVKSREKVLSALKSQLGTIQHAFEADRRNPSGGLPEAWGGNEWNEAVSEIPRAIENITKCHQTKH